jgi:ABC-type lipoprotein release transport system permease subunit
VTWQNLLKIGQLKEHPPDTAEIQRLLAAVALLASWLPARRAGRVESSLGLRGE